MRPQQSSDASPGGGRCRHRVLGLLLISLSAQPSPTSSFSAPTRILQKLRPQSVRTNQGLPSKRPQFFQQESTHLCLASAEDLPFESGDDIQEKPPGIWPCFDALDAKLIAIAGPVILNFAIAPLIGAVDLFWINRMGNALAVAGQAAANQVFNSAFWLASFLPSVTATFVSAENAAGNQEGVQDAICQALFVGMLFALFGGIALLLQPDQILSSVLKRKLRYLPACLRTSY